MQLNNSKYFIYKVRNNFSKDVLSTLSNSLWRIISGPVTLVFIPLFLTPGLQGYWYAFLSLSALSIFADLGFTTIVSQFAAHEYAYLNFNNRSKRFVGRIENIKKISSLFRFVLKWSITITFIGFPLILIAGIFMFYGKDKNINWFFPWLLFIVSSGLNFSTNVILSFLEGCDQIAEIQKNKLIASILITVSLCLFLYFRFNLYSLAITTFIGTLINLIQLLFRFKNILFQLYLKGRNYYVNWKADFFRLIWRYAISWSSGYFIVQIYTPLTFMFHGSIEAGKVGISTALATAMYSIANVWIYVSTPKQNMYASRKEWKLMDKLLVKSILLSVCTFLIGMIFVIIILDFYSNTFNILKRFLGIISLTTLLSAWLIQLIISGLTIYLRAHKQEPLVWVVLMGGIFILVSTFILSKFYSIDNIFLGFLAESLLLLPATYFIFIRKRKKWHNI